MTEMNHLSARHGDASNLVALKLGEEGEKGGGGVQGASLKPMHPFFNHSPPLLSVGVIVG